MLLIFDDDRSYQLLQTRVNEPYRHTFTDKVKTLFLISTLKRLRHDFFRNWLDFSDRQQTLF